MTSSNSNLFFRTNRPTREFQDDSDGASSVPGRAQNQVSTLQSTSCVLQQYMMAAMVEVICSLVENGDPTKTERLYKKVYQQLKRLKIMLPITTINEFAMVRHQFKNGFHALITRIRSDLQRETRSRFHPSTRAERVESIFFQPRLNHNLPALPAVDTIVFPHRYRDEYDQIEKIGKGAYGAVYRVKHKLDSSMYAMKLVEFSPKAESVQKVTREVRNLSNLSHRNVVRYFNAWIESDFSPFMCSDERGDVIQQETGEGNMSALEDPRALMQLRQPEGLDIDKVQRDDISGDSVVQFVSSTPGQKLDASVNPTHHSVDQQSANGSSEQPYSQASLNESMPEYPHDNQIITQMCSTLYIQMELCESNLKDWLTYRNDRHSKKECEVSKQDNMNILKQILKAVEYIHSKDLIHRDLKPHNIFINTNSQTMEIKLGDFGLSRHIQTSNPLADEAVAGVSSTSARPSPELTPHPGITDGFDWTLKTQGVGTTIYAAPEQLQGNDYNNKSDMYSLGLIAYELYCPFNTETERRICLSNVRTQALPKDFQSLWPTEGQFIQELLSQDHRHRPSAKDLLSSALFLTKDQIIRDMDSERDQLKAEIFSLRQELKTQSDKVEHKDSEIVRLRLENLMLHETVKQLQPRN